MKIEIEGEQVYLKKGGLGWKVIYPIKDDNGKIIIKHLLVGGSWWNLIFITIFIFLIIGVAFEYKQNMKTCIDVIEKYNAMQEIVYPEKNKYNKNMFLLLDPINLTELDNEER